MAEKYAHQQNKPLQEFPLSFFTCPNTNCADFNRFDAGNLSIAERMGKDKAIRRLYCKTCKTRFSEREGSLMANAKLDEPTVVRIIKCLGHGCSIEATADICEVDQRTVEKFLEKAGRRAEDFHRLQLERLEEVKGKIQAVQMDELHGRVAKSASGGSKKGANLPKGGPKTLLGRIVEQVEHGFIRLWM